METAIQVLIFGDVQVTQRFRKGERVYLKVMPISRNNPTGPVNAIDTSNGKGHYFNDQNAIDEVLS